MQPLAGRLLRLGNVIPTINSEGIGMKMVVCGNGSGGNADITASMSALVISQSESHALARRSPAEGGDSEMRVLEGDGVVMARSLSPLPLGKGYGSPAGRMVGKHGSSALYDGSRVRPDS
ncbi:hypothetical protein Tco_0026869 [Tanacetum coccineum]